MSIRTLPQLGLFHVPVIENSRLVGIYKILDNLSKSKIISNSTNSKENGTIY